MSASSLAGLQNKLNRLGTTRKDTSTDITDIKTWMNTWIEKIQHQGNQPEDWLEYTQYMRDKHNHMFNDKVARHNFLCDIYEKAFEAIPHEENKKNLAYARLFVEYSQIKRQFLPDEAKRILSHARAVVRRFAIVHVASAELELEEGNTSKAKKIIEKAQLFRAEPESLLKEALSRLKSGNTVLMFYDDLPGITVTGNTGDLSLQCPSSNERTANTTTDIARARQNSGGSDTENLALKDITDNTQDKFLNLKAKLSNSCRTRGMKSYHSTPEIRDVNTNVDTASTARWKRKNVLDFGAPMRVKKLNLPFKEDDDNDIDEILEEKVDDNDTLASFKPLEPQANSTLFSLSVAHSSGYLSMAECTIPLENDKSVLDGAEGQETMPSKENVQENQSHKAEKENKFEKPLLKPAKENILEMSARKPTKENVPDNLAYKNSLQNMRTPSTKGNIPVPCTPNVAQMEMLEVNGQQYAVLKLIGRGGSSKVYKVFDSDLKTKAIKVVKLDDADERTVNGYKNEINLLQRLQYCSRVIKLYDFEYNEEKNILYIVMEEGSDDFALVLKNQLKEDGKLSSNSIKYNWEAMLKAVGALHKEGIIHSDLKPSNFILVGGILKLIDFGIAKSIQNDKTSVLTDTQVGTLNYMSPETITDTCGDFSGESERGRPVYKIGTASDVWSLGCILYNMVYGCTPFQKYVKQFAKLRAIVDPSVPIQFHEIPDKYLMDVMQKCLTRDPKRRPTIEDLLNHPYLMAGKEEEEEKDSKANVCNDQLVERLVRQLADKFAASPTGIRSLVNSAIKNDNGSALGDIPMNPFISRTVASAAPPMMTQPKSTQSRPTQPGVTNVKEIRAPLKCLSIQDIHSKPKFLAQNDPKI